MFRSPWLVVLLAVPFPLGAALVTRSAFVHAAEVGEVLSACCAPAISRAVAPPRLDVPPAVVTELSPDGDSATADPVLSERARPASKRSRVSSRPTRSLRLRSATVLGIANSGFVPEGVEVSGPGETPRGIRLVNVSGLGLGLRDGDVLVSAAGHAAPSVADVVAAVVAARARRLPEIGGTLWRNGELWQLVVELPYPETG